jgi:hypothetical protein
MFVLVRKVIGVGETSRAFLFLKFSFSNAYNQTISNPNMAAPTKMQKKSLNSSPHHRTFDLFHLERQLAKSDSIFAFLLAL